MAPTPIHSDAAPSYIDRIQDFVSENRRAVLVVATAAVVAAGAVYYTSSRPSSGKGKSKDKKSKKKSVNDPDGPIIEEIKPNVQGVDGMSFTSFTAGPDHALTENAPLSAEQIAAMPFEVCSFRRHYATCSSPVSLQERVKQAASLKTRGNSLYQARKFEQAIDLYTQAIQVSPRPEPVFYSNRAACPSQLSSVLQMASFQLINLVPRLYVHVPSTV